MTRLACILAATLLAIGVTGIAFAFHNNWLYLGEDSGRQKTVPPGVENFVLTNWGLQQGVLLWHPAEHPHIDPHVNATIASWTSSVPALPGVQVADEASANVSFRYSYCPNPLTAIACREITEWFPDQIRNANYDSKEIIWFNPTLNWQPQWRRGTVAHEIGHVYGLHDRYLISDVDPAIIKCNNNETSIMDGAKNNDHHCDNLDAPTNLDRDRVIAYWSQGQIAHL